MNREPCTEEVLRELATVDHGGDLRQLLAELEAAVKTTKWPPGRAHLENDILELRLIIAHEERAAHV